MPSSQSQTRAPSDIEADYDPKLSHIGRHGGEPGVSNRLAVTSKLHPFWHTKRGIFVIILVILSIVGGIVGGVVGGRSGNNDSSRRNFGLPSTTAISTASSETSTISDGGRSSASSATKASVTFSARAYPVRRDIQVDPGTVAPAIFSVIPYVAPAISPAMVADALPMTSVSPFQS